MHFFLMKIRYVLNTYAQETIEHTLSKIKHSNNLMNKYQNLPKYKKIITNMNTMRTLEIPYEWDFLEWIKEVADLAEHFVMVLPGLERETKSIQI